MRRSQWIGWQDERRARKNQEGRAWGRYAFSEKARLEMEADRLTELDVAESILNAVAIYKKIRSTSFRRQQRREYLYVIQSTNLDGLPIYTKGKLVQEVEIETYYFLVSSKRAL